MVAEKKGVRCSLECIDRDGAPRFCAPDSDETICSVCRANMAGWSAKDMLLAEMYEAHLGVRGRRMHEVTHPSPKSYVARLKLKRKRRKH